jgi:hypothetical protein
MVSLHRIRGFEPDSIGLYPLLPHDDLLAKAGCEGLKGFGELG